jgi:hypothetical protein
MPDFCLRSGCRAQVLWLRHETTGKSAPIDPEPVEGGNIAIVGEGEHRMYRIVPAGERVGPLHLNHWVTCTDKPPRKT